MTDHPALQLAADIMAALPGQCTSSIIDKDGYESEQFNLIIQQHPISGVINISVRPGSPLEAPIHFNAIQAAAKRHGATWDLPIEPKPKKPRQKAAKPA